MIVARQIAALIVLLVVSPLWASQLTENEQKLKILQSRINRLQQELKQEIGQRDSVRNVLEREERDILSIQRVLSETAARLSKQKQQLNGLRATAAKLRTDLQSQHQRLSLLVKAKFMAGPQEPLRLLLNQQDPAAVDRTFAYYSYIARARNEQFMRINTDLAALRQAEQDLAQGQRELQALLEAQKERQAELTTRRGQRQQLLIKLERQIRSDDRELRRLQGNAKHLANLLSKLKTQLMDLPAPGPGFAAAQGHLALPVAAPIQARFGQPRAVPGTTWRGLMFRASAGTPVNAIFDGRVVYADWFRGFGLLLIIDHGQGYMSLYSHNQELLKGVGAAVGRGEKVALVGDTGGLAQAGLYFELRHNGTPRDPLQWCKLRN